MNTNIIEHKDLVFGNVSFTNKPDFAMFQSNKTNSYLRN